MTRRFNGIDWQAVREKYRAPVIAAKSDAEMYLALKAMMRELKRFAYAHRDAARKRRSPPLCHACIRARFCR